MFFGKVLLFSEKGQRTTPPPKKKLRTITSGRKAWLWAQIVPWSISPGSKLAMYSSSPKFMQEKFVFLLWQLLTFRTHQSNYYFGKKNVSECCLHGSSLHAFPARPLLSRPLLSRITHALTYRVQMGIKCSLTQIQGISFLAELCDYIHFIWGEISLSYAEPVKTIYWGGVRIKMSPEITKKSCGFLPCIRKVRSQTYIYQHKGQGKRA